jgi:group I intron endonuclease
MTGIYAIENIATGEVYVGQSRNIPNRYQQHLSMLERGEHHSLKLQKAYNSTGAEGFTLKILELCDESELDRKEQEWIQKLDAYDKGYNMRNQTELPSNLDSFYVRAADSLHRQFRNSCKELGLSPTEAIQLLIKCEIEETKRNIELLQSIQDSFSYIATQTEGSSTKQSQQKSNQRKESSHSGFINNGYGRVTPENYEKIKRVALEYRVKNGRLPGRPKSSVGLYRENRRKDGF